MESKFAAMMNEIDSDDGDDEFIEPGGSLSAARGNWHSDESKKRASGKFDRNRYDSKREMNLPWRAVDESSSTREMKRFRDPSEVAGRTNNQADTDTRKSRASRTNRANSQADIDTRRASLLRAANRGEKIECYVTRDRTKANYWYPVYRLYNESTGRFLLAAKKRAGKQTSNYIVTMSEYVSGSRSNEDIGKVRAHWSGSEYAIFDHGLRPTKSVVESQIRKELGVAAFEYDHMGPGKMRCVVPRLNHSGIPRQIRSQADREKSEISESLSGRVSDKVHILFNKKPQWDEAIGGHVLNFRGRVTEPSVKNFQLACEDTGDDVVLQFGRIDKDKFSMDYAVRRGEIVFHFPFTLSRKFHKSSGFTLLLQTIART